MFLFFTAAFLIITGIYEQKLAAAEEQRKIEYRFIPRTFYEEQLAKTNTVTDRLGSMFDKESPWFDRTVGPLLETPFDRKLGDGSAKTPMNRAHDTTKFH